MTESAKPASATTTRRDDFWAQGVRVMTVGAFRLAGPI